MMLQRLTKFGLLLTTAVIVLTLAFEAPVVKGQGKGKGGGGNDSSGDVPAIASFDDGVVVPDRIRSDGGGDYVDSDLAATGGWANFPNSGAFTLQTDGQPKNAPDHTRRKLTLDFTATPPVGDLPPDCDIQVDDQGFVPTSLTTPAFMSLSGTSDEDLPIEALGLNQSTAAGVGAHFRDPNDSKATFFLRCGKTTSNKDACGTDTVTVVCNKVADLSGPCVEWRTDPTPVSGDLRCRLWRDSRGNSVVIGDFNMPFGLTVFRDADSDGVPDLGNSP